MKIIYILYKKNLTQIKKYYIEHKTNLEYIEQFFSNKFKFIYLSDEDIEIQNLTNKIIIIGMQSSNFLYKPKSNNNIIYFDREYTNFGKIASNKYKTFKYLNKHNIDTIPTSLYKSIKENKYPFILKDIEGYNGNNVFLVKNKNTLKNLLSKYKEINFIQQPFIQNSIGIDIRIFIINNKIFSYKRINKNDFRSNITLGSSIEKYTLNKFQFKSVLNLLKHLNNDFIIENKLIGIDIFDDDKFKIIELNSNPGFFALIKLFKEEFKTELSKFLKLN